MVPSEAVVRPFHPVSIARPVPGTVGLKRVPFLRGVVFIPDDGFGWNLEVSEKESETKT